MKVWTAVWEWNDGSGEDPEVFVATTRTTVERAAFRYMTMVTMDRDLRLDELPEWLRENPPTEVDSDDPAAVQDWLDGFKAAATAPWLTVEEQEVIGA